MAAFSVVCFWPAISISSLPLPHGFVARCSWQRNNTHLPFLFPMGPPWAHFRTVADTTTFLKTGAKGPKVSLFNTQVSCAANKCAKRDGWRFSNVELAAPLQPDPLPQPVPATMGTPTKFFAPSTLMCGCCADKLTGRIFTCPTCKVWCH